MKRRLLKSFAVAAGGLAIGIFSLAFPVLAQDRNPAVQQRALVLKGGLLIDGARDEVLRDAVVVLSGGRIQNIGTEATVKIPADATVIDTSGKTIMPGLINSHVHMRNFLAPLFLYWGVTTVGDLGNPTGWTLAYRDAIAQRRVAGPTIWAAGAKFDPPLKVGDPMVTGDLQGFQTFLLGNSARVYVTDRASVAQGIARVKKQGVDAVKLYTRMDPALMKITAAEAHRNGLPVFAHYTSASTRQGLFTGTDEILDTGIDVHVHLFGLVKATAPKEIRDRIARGEAVQAWHLLDTSKFPPLIDKMVQVKMFLNPTLGSQFKNASKYRQEFDRLNTAFLNGPTVANFPEALVRGRFAAAFAPPMGPGTQELAEGYKRAGQFVMEFVARGGKVIAGDDTGAGAGSGTPGLAQHLELRMLEEAGLTPIQAIRAATLWSAEAWGKSKDVGTIEAGKRADLLVLNRNPLEDPAATTDIYRVIQGGVVVDREALAKWQETLPRPGAVIDPLPGYPNPLIHVPFIDEISPEWLTSSQKGRSELTISGENFSNENLVLINDRLVPARMEGPDQLRVSIPSGTLKKPGTYPLMVVQPGSGGGVSNTFYLIVTAD